MNQPLPDYISLADFLLWEEAQDVRHEWIDGTVVPYGGASSDHSTIIDNMSDILRKAIAGGPCYLQHSDRQLVPRNRDGVDLGSFYADLFVSCGPEDRSGNAAHFPVVIVEVVSPRVGAEYTKKKRAYLASRDIADYLIIESTTRAVTRFSWITNPSGQRRLVTADTQHGPLLVPAYGLRIPFDDIYAGTAVPTVLHALNVEYEIDVELD